MIRIGILDQTSKGWSAGQTFTSVLLHSLYSVAVEQGFRIYLLTSHQWDETMELPNVERVLLKDYEHAIPKAIRENKIEVVLPLVEMPFIDWGIPLIGWIADFQHRHLVQLFSSDEISFRESRFRNLAHFADRVLISSRAVQADFMEVFPEQKSKMALLPFPSNIGFAKLGDNPKSVLLKYNLPDKFILVSNQFWGHKNHLLVLEAMRLLLKRNFSCPLVLTGLPSDFRDPSNKLISEILQFIAKSGLQKSIFILGALPYGDLIEITRMASLVVQPSLFEGWSTVVQDALALGKQLICSDIPVHREQAELVATFFNPLEASDLANKVEQLWPLQHAAYDEVKEREALRVHKDQVRKYGAALLQVCLEAIEVYQSKSDARLDRQGFSMEGRSLQDHQIREKEREIQMMNLALENQNISILEKERELQEKHQEILKLLSISEARLESLKNASTRAERLHDELALIKNHWWIQLGSFLRVWDHS